MAYYTNTTGTILVPTAITTSGALTCYEFNGTNEAQAEVTISTKQLEQLTKENVVVSTQNFAKGYSTSTPLFTTQKFSDATGKCMTTAAANDVLLSVNLDPCLFREESNCQL